MAHDVFISYSSKDIEEVELLCKALKEAGITYWQDRKDILPGDVFSAEISDAIEKCKILIFVSSQNSNQSDWVPDEVFYALNNKKIVVPFNLDHEEYNSRIKIRLTPFNQIKAFPPPIQEHLSNLILSVKNILEIPEEEKPYLKRITDMNDPDLKLLLEVYRSCFKGENVDKNVSEEFIILNLSIFTEKHQAYLFVLKTAIKVIGIADVSYFPDHNRLFVSYVGVYQHKNPGDKVIYTNDIVEGLMGYFKEKELPIDDIIFETEEERVYRYFNRVLKFGFNLNAYKLCFDYFQPALVSDNEAGVTREIPANLVYVPVKKNQHIKQLPKSKVLKIIKFIHDNIYLDITNKSMKEHQKYLEGIYEKYEKELPDFVPLEN